MRGFKFMLSLFIALLLGQTVARADAQRMSYSDTKKTIDRIRDRSDRFESNFQDAIDRTGLDSDVRHDMKRTVKRFEQSAKDLEQRYKKSDAANSYVRALLMDAALLDRFLSDHVLSSKVQDEWLGLKNDLDRLALSYDLSGVWPSALARVEPVVPRQPSGQEMRDLLQDLQLNTDAFQTNTTIALAELSADRQTSYMSQYMNDFRNSVGRLNSSYVTGTLTSEAVNDALYKAQLIDAFMRDHPLPMSSQESWIRVKNELTHLAAAYNFSPAWLR
jgi:hypothetical protein